MSEDKSNTWIVLLVVFGVLGSFSLCCLGGVGVVFYQAQRAEQEATRVVEEEIQRQRAEERYRRERFEEEQRREEMVRADIAVPTAPLGQTGIAGFRVPSAPPPAIIAPRQISARVTAVSGTPGVEVGDRCDFPVEHRPRRSGGYWCRVEVVCAGQRLYGGGTVGFVPCVMYDSPLGVVGLDGETSNTDTDGAFAIDTRDQLFLVQDDASGPQGEFTLEAHIESVR